MQAGRALAVDEAMPYIGDVLDETGQRAPAVGELAPAAFLATAPDGRDMATLLDQPLITARTRIAEGIAPVGALEMAGRQMTAIMLTVMADTRRAVYEADMVSRPTITGYVRMLNPPSCARCAILAGKWFRWNQGFQRHPRCDCQHIPAAENIAGDLRTDPYAYFDSLTPAEQNRVFTKNGARAIRDGADIYRVENIRMRGLATARGSRKYGTPSKLTLDDIYRIAGNDRAAAIALLRSEGYITRRGQVAAPRSPGVLTDAERLARGRGRGTYRLGGQERRTGRAARYDAAESGVRDPLERSTMTAAERRLYDASYRLQYARRTGYVPRSIGMNSADVYSGAQGIPATPEVLAQLEAALDRQVARIPRGSSLERLYVALGLADPALASAVFDRI